MFGTLFNVLKIAQLHVYKMINIKQTLHVKKIVNGLFKAIYRVLFESSWCSNQPIWDSSFNKTIS